MPTHAPFPGMDPYLEHPVLWTGVHFRLVNEISKQLAPKILPRYVLSVEERVYFEIPSEFRSPDVWVQDISQHSLGEVFSGGVAVATEAEVDAPVHVSLEPFEVHEKSLQILDLYQDEKIVTVIELLSPTNKVPGTGRDQYEQKQRSILMSQTHLVEIDLLRTGRRILSVPEFALRRGAPPAEYYVSVSRAEDRIDGQFLPCPLRRRLPRFHIPLAAPDPDVVLDLQAAFEQVYLDGGYFRRVKYQEPCYPPLPAEDQAWATACWNEYRAAHPEWFPARREPDLSPSQGNGSTGTP